MSENGILRRLNRILALVLMASMCLGLAGCTGSRVVTRAMFKMDTFMTLSIKGSEADCDAAEAIIDEVERLISVTNPNSDIYKLNAEGSAVLNPLSLDILNKAFIYEELTEGAIDISIYPVVSEWGFTTGEYKVPEESKLEELLQNVDYRKIVVAGSEVSLASDMKIDLGCIGKGYTGDLIVEKLSEAGVKSAMINLGGNVQTIGMNEKGKPWRIAIADPKDTSTYIGVVEVSDKAVVTSGGYERFFEENGMTYHHIIDPLTGRPAANGVLSATIVGPSGTTCDAMSTAVFVMGLEKSVELWKTESELLKDTDFIIVDSEGVIYVTNGLATSFESASGRKVTVINR